MIASPIGQTISGIGLGVGFGVGVSAGLQRAYDFLAERIGSSYLIDPLNGLSLNHKILITPLICVLLPLLEEKTFRGDLQEILQSELQSFYVSRLGFSVSEAKSAARITSLFFTSVLFGLIHFSNAIVCWCHPLVFLPQVVITTVLGFIFGVAKEFSGELFLPTGMHMGYNTFIWTQYINSFL